MARLIPDEPIRTVDQDRLNRRGFATTLAKQILVGDPTGCVVIGIHGPYGSGKSSLLNLVERELSSLNLAEEKPPVVIRFNPWNFSTVEQLILMFFGTLSAALGRRDRSETARAIAEKLDQFGELLAPIGTLVAAHGLLGFILQIPVVIARVCCTEGGSRRRSRSKRTWTGCS